MHTAIQMLEPTASKPITVGALLGYVTKCAQVAKAANFHVLAAGVLTALTATVWAPRGHRKTRSQVRSMLFDAFCEDQNPNFNPGESKRYEFANLCIEMAPHPQMRILAAKAAQQDSVQAAVDFLAAEFGVIAQSVAHLARHFGTQRQSGGQGVASPASGIDKPFLEWLRARLIKAGQNGEMIPFIGAVALLLPVATAEQKTDLLKRLARDNDVSDEALNELAHFCMSTIVHRQRRNSLVDEHPTT